MNLAMGLAIRSNSAFSVGLQGLTPLAGTLRRDGGTR